MTSDHLTKEYLDFRFSEHRLHFDAKLEKLRFSLILSFGTLMTAIMGFFKVVEHFGK